MSFFLKTNLLKLINENTEQIIIYTDIFLKAWLIKTSWILLPRPFVKRSTKL